MTVQQRISISKKLKMVNNFVHCAMSAIALSILRGPTLMILKGRLTPIAGSDYESQIQILVNL